MRLRPTFTEPVIYPGNGQKAFWQQGKDYVGGQQIIATDWLFYCVVMMDVEWEKQEKKKKGTKGKKKEKKKKPKKM